MSANLQYISFVVVMMLLTFAVDKVHNSAAACASPPASPIEIDQMSTEELADVVVRIEIHTHVVLSLHKYCYDKISVTVSKTEPMTPSPAFDKFAVCKDSFIHALKKLHSDNKDLQAAQKRASVLHAKKLSPETIMIDILLYGRIGFRLGRAMSLAKDFIEKVIPKEELRLSRSFVPEKHVDDYQCAIWQSLGHTFDLVKLQLMRNWVRTLKNAEIRWNRETLEALRKELEDLKSKAEKAEMAPKPKAFERVLSFDFNHQLPLREILNEALSCIDISTTGTVSKDITIFLNDIVDGLSIG